MRLCPLQGVHNEACSAPWRPASLLQGVLTARGLHAARPGRPHCPHTWCTEMGMLPRPASFMQQTCSLLCRLHTAIASENVLCLAVLLACHVGHVQLELVYCTMLAISPADRLGRSAWNC